MYKPANFREFVTTAIHKKTEVENIGGRTQKKVVLVAKLRGKFKQKGTSEINANGLLAVNDKTSFVTWWKSDFEAGDLIEIGGIDYRVIGTPENVEMRGRYAVLNLERIGGGA
jgi:hypothetical protein